MPTLFEKIWKGDIPSLPVLRHDTLEVMAILANPQETVGQAVIFPKRAVGTFEELDHGQEQEMLLATRALARHMRSVLGVERVVRHVEGYGVPDHAHTVLVPSYQRGDSDRIHHPSERLPFEVFAEQCAHVQETLTVPADVIQNELFAHQAYMQALIEDAT
ncbi:MAG TPA: hypothetical protein VK983_03880 [Candidatus Limnocylindrales bacterium]|nr:hypothetical protein [Candidatus Limnocylindrales bacterium]